MYRRLSGCVTVPQGVRISALTGVCAGVLGLVLNLVGLAGAVGFTNGVGSILPADAIQGMDFTLPAWGSIVFNLIGFLFNILFGTIGGWIGGLIFNPDRKAGKG
jgi:hypothetical protein